MLPPTPPSLLCDAGSARLLFTARGLGYRYPDGTQALTDILLDIEPGERIALIGPNGSGKTTLIKQLCGLLPPTQGQVCFRGHPLAGEHLERSRLSMGLLFQDPDDQLFGHTLVEDVAFGLRQQGASQLAAERTALQALERVGLSALAYKAPHHLSFGQKKRAALAGLLAIAPEVLLLDEPTANLDPLQEELMLDLLTQFPGAVICVSHDLIFLYEMCRRAVVLDQGRIRHDQPMSELVSHRHSLREHGLDFSFRLTIAPPEPTPSAATAKEVTGLNEKPAGRLLGPPALIELRDLRYDYPDGTRALRGIDLTIQAGERVSIVGENGAGKSTLLACLLGLHQADGIYRFSGEVVTRKTRQRLWQDIQMVFQDCADQLFCPTVREEITFGPRQLGLSRSEIDHRLDRALALVHLEGFAERVPLHLSGGERKRLALACVLAMDPKLIILDEPAAGLDPQGEELLLNILRSLPGGLLMVSHDIFFVRELTQRTLVLHQGYLLEDMTTENFLKEQRFGRLNGLSYSYRQRSGDAIRQLQHAHEHSHTHYHLHSHPHTHGEVEHDHLHEHAHQHPHGFTHAHPGRPEKRHDHSPRRYHDHEHPEHDIDNDNHH